LQLSENIYCRQRGIGGLLGFWEYRLHTECTG
jgi:hypothetical protein